MRSSAVSNVELMGIDYGGLKDAEEVCQRLLIFSLQACYHAEKMKNPSVDLRMHVLALMVNKALELTFRLGPLTLVPASNDRNNRPVIKLCHWLRGVSLLHSCTRSR